MGGCGQTPSATKLSRAGLGAWLETGRLEHDRSHLTLVEATHPLMQSEAR
jgi:hypothetical protein